MRPCFAFSNSAGADNKPAVLTIFEDIGMWGTQAKDFLAQLGAVKAEALSVEINSPGGDVFAALAMYNGLRASGKKITTKNMGVAASAASIVFMAGDIRVMPANTHLMVHNPWTVVAGNAEELRDQASVLDSIGNSLAKTYATRSGMSDEDVKAMLAKDTWLTADESKALNLATEVIDGIEAKASFDMERADLPEAVRAAFNKKAPPAAPAPAPAPAPAVEGALADQVAALAKAEGFDAYAATWAIKYATVAEVTARIAEVKEIKALCTVAKLDAKFDEIVKAGTSLADSRKVLIDAQAAADQHVDTTRKNSNQPTTQGPSAVTTAGIWAKHRKQTAGV